MEVKLLHNSPLWLASHAIRMSHDNHDKSDSKAFETEAMFNDGTSETFMHVDCGEKDKALIARVGNKLKHKSVLEQLVYWFDIDGISRACLQELARHRTARLTVKSSRYTLNELRTEAPLVDWDTNMIINEKGASRYLVKTSDKAVNYNSHYSLGLLQHQLKAGVSNDISKYCLPESFKTRLQWQIDGRNLQNFLALRTSKDALWEIQLLARSIYAALPEEHKYLYSDYVTDPSNCSTDSTDATTAK